MPTYEELERAYQDAVVGTKPPTCVVASGEMILRHRPDLIGVIDPAKAYYVTNEFISEVEADA